MKKIKYNTILILLFLSINTYAQSDPFVGQIMWVPYNFTPKNWHNCDGALLPISQNTALFSLLGTRFGGDGKTTFALPDMRGKTIIGASANYDVGSQVGVENVTLLVSEIPSHTHIVNAVTKEGNNNLALGAYFADTNASDKEYSNSPPNTTMSAAMTSQSGASQPHNNMQPFATLKCIIAMQGIFPPLP